VAWCCVDESGDLIHRDLGGGSYNGESRKWGESRKRGKREWRAYVEHMRTFCHFTRAVCPPGLKRVGAVAHKVGSGVAILC
jgi:hypothetical protein